MDYISTRGGSDPLPFHDVLIEGLAMDGGLFVPNRWPSFNIDQLSGLKTADYATTAAFVMRNLVGDSFEPQELEELCRGAYKDFNHAATAPLKQIGHSEWLLELFHGPTLAFKDFAMRLLGLMFERVLERKGQRITIVGATSGDTGSAAIHACAGRANIDIFVLFPKGRVSEVQRRQMTTVMDSNVHCFAIDGTFDDCQALVKSLFADVDFRRKLSLAAINSINWARISAQIVYYIYAGIRLGALENPLRFIVPTGNFGDVYAGYAAAQMGLPITELVVATNNNDLLSRFFDSGVYEAQTVQATLSPSMDIQVASNFERLLFETNDRNGTLTADQMSTFGRTRRISVDWGHLKALRPRFRAGRANEDETLKAMREVLASCGELIDPHTAVGVSVGRRVPPEIDQTSSVYLATAHPAKFPESVERANNVRPDLPQALQWIETARERYGELPNDADILKSQIQQVQAAKH